jgi:hypothetical protein
MEASIKVKVSELNGALLERIQALFKGKDDAELTISFNEDAYNYYETLSSSKHDLEQKNNLVTFTIDELEAYTANRKSA